MMSLHRARDPNGSALGVQQRSMEDFVRSVQQSNEKGKIVILQQVSTDEAPPPGGPYSQGLVSGGFVFIAGQVPFDPEGKIVGESFAQQARQAFENLRSIAKASGTDLSRTIRVGVYLRDMDDFAEMNTIFAEYFSEPLPVRTTIPVALVGIRIEIDAIVAMPEG